MRRRGFTLIEALVLAGILAVLLALLMPTLGAARQHARTIQCLSNLRQLAIAAQAYCADNDDFFPIAQCTASTPGGLVSYAWDFTTSRDALTGQLTVRPGLLWAGDLRATIQQCPSFNGSSNTFSDPFTGYNYNTSYIGHGEGESIVEPARRGQVRRPVECAIFGDGQMQTGANKYMRSPFPSPGDATFLSRTAGTQGFRHRGGTNVAFVDGHVQTLWDRHLATSDNASPGTMTGFLSEDNSMYQIN